MMSTFSTVVTAQRSFFQKGKTKSHAFRVAALKKLKQIISDNLTAINHALYLDLHKHETESFLTEINLVNTEIDFALKNVASWMKPQLKSSPFPACWPGRSQVRYEPYGVVLIVSPWNFPFYLTLMPLIGAIAAGNCVIVKPSEVALATEKLILKLINQHFEPEFCIAVSADAEKTKMLLQEKFDYIFYTGNARIGREIMHYAANHLTPVTLELGGKSPCIIDKDVNLNFATRRIIWAKFLNAGQTCIAPDYVFVPLSQKQRFIEISRYWLRQFFGNEPENNASYSRIINLHHFERLKNLLAKHEVLLGGEMNETNLYISPTLIDKVTWLDPVLQAEIFGPILPIITYESLDEVISQINTGEKPLALYYFSHHKKNIEQIINQISFGGGCINDCLVQIANHHLPFGGVGMSGLGRYHGRYSFETFSHQKSIFIRSPLIDIPLTYPPYTARKTKWLKRLLKLRWL